MGSDNGDMVLKNLFELSRDAVECFPKLLSCVQEKYLERYGREIVTSALLYSCKLIHGLMLHMGEKTEADEALRMSGVKFPEEFPDEAKQLAFLLAEDSEFSCSENTAGVSMYIAILSVVKELSRGK
jgi:hypothetical protein